MLKSCPCPFSNFPHHSIDYLLQGQVSSIYIDCTLGLFERRQVPLYIPMIPELDFVGDSLQGWFGPSLPQLLIPTPRPDLHRGIEVELQMGIRKDHAADIPPLDDHSTLSPHLALQVQEPLSDWSHRRNH